MAASASSATCCVSPRHRRKLVRTAEAAVAAATEQAAAERARGGCKELCGQREAEERAAREALLKAQENRAATVKAVDLDGRIASAEEALNKLDVKVGPNESRLRCGVLSLGCGPWTVTLQHVANGLIENRKPEIGQGAHNPIIAPVPVLTSHANNQLREL